MLTIASKKKYVYHYDVKTAFLKRDLKGIVFKKQPEGFEFKGKKTFGWKNK